MDWWNAVRLPVSSSKRWAVIRVSRAILKVLGCVGSVGSAGPVYSRRVTSTLSFTILRLLAVPMVCSAVRSRDSFEPGLPPYVILKAFYPLVLTVYHPVRSAYIITHVWLRLGLRTRGCLSSLKDSLGTFNSFKV